MARMENFSFNHTTEINLLRIEYFKGPFDRNKEKENKNS